MIPTTIVFQVKEESDDDGGNVAEFEASFAKLRNTDGPGSLDLAHDVQDPQVIIFSL